VSLGDEGEIVKISVAFIEREGGNLKISAPFPWTNHDFEFTVKGVTGGGSEDSEWLKPGQKKRKTEGRVEFTEKENRVCQGGKKKWDRVPDCS